MTFGQITQGIMH